VEEQIPGRQLTPENAEKNTAARSNHPKIHSTKKESNTLNKKASETE